MRRVHRVCVRVRPEAHFAHFPSSFQPITASQAGRKAGARHARTVIRSLLKGLSKLVQRIELTSVEPRMEREESYSRQVGYDSVGVQFTS